VVVFFAVFGGVVFGGFFRLFSGAVLHRETFCSGCVFRLPSSCVLRSPISVDNSTNAPQKSGSTPAYIPLIPHRKRLANCKSTSIRRRSTSTPYRVPKDLREGKFKLRLGFLHAIAVVVIADWLEFI
jgi:hypothetical protein